LVRSILTAPQLSPLVASGAIDLPQMLEDAGIPVTPDLAARLQGLLATQPAPAAGDMSLHQHDGIWDFAKGGCGESHGGFTRGNDCAKGSSGGAASKSRSSKNRSYMVEKHGKMPRRRPNHDSHHGMMSAWMRANFKNYDPKKAPAVLLPRKRHHKTYGVYSAWRTEMTKKMNGNFQWNKVSEKEKRALANKMFTAAKVPKHARRKYWAEYAKMMTALRAKGTRKRAT
jgi:hypothetical protein